MHIHMYTELVQCTYTCAGEGPELLKGQEVLLAQRALVCQCLPAGREGRPSPLPAPLAPSVPPPLHADCRMPPLRRHQPYDIHRAEERKGGREGRREGGREGGREKERDKINVSGHARGGDSSPSWSGEAPPPPGHHAGPAGQMGGGREGG